MSDDKNINDELEKELLEEAGDGAFDELDDIDDGGLDDFVSELDDLSDDSSLDDSVELYDPEDSLDSPESLDDMEERTDDSEDDLLDDELESDLDQQINDLDQEIEDLEKEGKESVKSKKKEKKESEPDGEKKKFKLKPFHIAAAGLGVFALFVVGSKLMPTSSPKPQKPVAVEKVQTEELAKKLPVEEDPDVTNELPEHLVKALDKSKSEDKEDKTANNTLEKDIETSVDDIAKEKTEDALTDILEEKNQVQENDLLAGVNNQSLIDELLKDRERADAISIKTLTQDEEIVIIRGQNDQRQSVGIGDYIDYYDSKLRVDNIVDGGNIILLSEGLFVDKERSEINSDKVEEIRKKLIAEQKEKARKSRENEAKLNEMVQAAIMLEKEKLAKEMASKEAELEKKYSLSKDKEREVETIKSPKGTLDQAIDRITQIEHSLNDPKEPKLLSGWSINGNFKEPRSGYVLNGYLIKNAHGDFFKVIVGDKFQSYGIVKGYDDNGKFFIGNYYIL